jgi:hypothetical protein
MEDYEEFIPAGQVVEDSRPRMLVYFISLTLGVLIGYVATYLFGRPKY